MALLTTVISVLVQIAVCKCHLRRPKSTSGGANLEVSAAVERHEYAQVDGCVAVNDPIYMEVETEGESSLNFKRNEAYRAAIALKTTSFSTNTQILAPK